MFVKSQPMSKFVLLRRRKGILKPVPVKRDLGRPRKECRRNSEAKRKQIRECKQKAAYDILPEHCQRKFLECPNMECGKIEQTRSLGAIYSLRCCRYAIFTVLFVARGHAKRAEQSEPDKSDEYERSEMLHRDHNTPRMYGLQIARDIIDS